MLTNNPVTYQALWKRVTKHNENLKIIQSKTKTIPTSIPVKTNDCDDGTSVSTLTPPRSTLTLKRKDPPEGNGNTNVKKKKKPAKSKKLEDSSNAVKASLASLPGWCDQSKTNATLTRRKKRTCNQVTRDNFSKQAAKQYNETRYKEAFKFASAEYASNLSQSCAGTKGLGARAVARKYNESHLYRVEDKKISGSTLHRYVVDLGKAGESPLKNGRPSIIPPQLTKAIATHATMMQVSAEEGEASRQKMLIVVRALKIGTEWEGKFDEEYVWRKTRKDHPALLNPVKAKNHEDRRADWLTYNNINDWTDRAKAFMIEFKFVKDAPGFICKVFDFNILRKIPFGF